MEWDLHEALLKQIFTYGEAYTGTILSAQLRKQIAALTGCYFEKIELKEFLRNLPKSFPKLYITLQSDLIVPEQPEKLGWINWWSASTRRFLDFPESLGVDAIYSHSYEDKNDGSVMFKITEQEIDLSDDNHLRNYTIALHLFENIAFMKKPIRK